MDNFDSTQPPAVLTDSGKLSSSSKPEKTGKSGLLGTAAWTGTMVRFRLSRAADPTRKWKDLRDFVDVLGEPIDSDPARAVAQGRRVANDMSCEVLASRSKPLPPRPTTLSVDQWFELWCSDRLRSGAVTDDDSDRCIYRKHLAPFIGSRPMAEVSQQEIESIVAHLDELIVLARSEGGKALGGLAWKTASNIWTVLSAMFRDAKNAKPARGLRVRADDPTADVEAPERGEKRERTFLYPSDYLLLVTSQALWDSTGRNVLVARHYRRWARLFTLAVYLMMRAGELRAIRWEHIDLEHRTIIVKIAARRGKRKGEDKSTKSANVRMFEIPEALMPLLRVMREEAGGASATGRVLKMPGSKELSCQLRRYCRLAGISREDIYADTEQQAPLTFHDLRATGITWRARDAKANPYAIMQAAGHRDLETTQIYIRRVQALPAEFGQPFPTIPAIVLGELDAVAGPATNGTPGTSDEQSAQPGPELDQNVTKEAESLAIPSPRSGPHNDRAHETPSILQHSGPSEPRDSTDRDQSNTVASQPADLESTIRAALDLAILAGNMVAAGKLASALAGERASLAAAQVVTAKRWA